MLVNRITNQCSATPLYGEIRVLSIVLGSQSLYSAGDIIFYFDDVSEKSYVYDLLRMSKKSISQKKLSG